MARLSLSEIKSQYHKPAPAPQPKKGEDITIVPTMVPTLVKKGDGMLEVSTRQKFVTSGVDDWIEWHTTRSAAILCAAGAIILFPVNLWLSAGVAGLAGHYYGKHVWKNHHINTNLKHRKVLYTR